MGSLVKKALPAGASSALEPTDSGVAAEKRDRYVLQVSAGPCSAGDNANEPTHKMVRVNGEESIAVENAHVRAWAKVSIKDYEGLPQTSPKTSPYFSHPLHQSDLYSIRLSFVPKEAIPGDELVLGFELGNPIRHRLPPGFKKVMSIVTTLIEPTIESDPYCDEPFLHGPALSGFFAFRVGEKSGAGTDGSEAMLDVIEEGADGSGEEVRRKHCMPDRGDKRRKHFRNVDKMKAFEFEAGRLYQADFFNGYLDFANYAVHVPGISMSVVKWIDDKTHTLRYVLKNRRTGTVYFEVVFQMLFGQMLEDALREDEKQKDFHPDKAEERAASEPSSTAGQSVDGIPPSTDHGPESEPHLSQNHPATAKHAETDDSQDGAVQDDTQVLESHNDSTAGSSLAQRIAATLAWLGFGWVTSQENTSEADEHEKSHAHRQIDHLDDATVEEFLRSRNQS